MKTFRFAAVALAALAMVSMTGCQAMIEQTPEYQMKQAEKAYQAKVKAEAEAFNTMGEELYGGMSVAEAMNLHAQKEEARRQEWERTHPGEAFYDLPWSSAPGAKRVEIGGKSYYCAPTASGDIHCE